MSNPFLNQGPGTLLRKVTGASGNVPSVPETTTIPAGGYTETVAGQEGLEILFWLVFDEAATGDIVVQRLTNRAAQHSNDHGTVTIAGLASYCWAAGETLVGYYRVYNNTDQPATVAYNNRKA